LFSASSKKEIKERNFFVLSNLKKIKGNNNNPGNTMKPAQRNFFVLDNLKKRDKGKKLLCSQQSLECVKSSLKQNSVV